MCAEFSKVERKVEQFAYMKFLNWVEDGHKVYWHSLEVARLLYRYGYRGKYVFTAFCQYLPQHVGTTTDQIKENCGRFTAEAVAILAQKTPNKRDYADQIFKNEVARVVKMADFMVSMQDIMMSETTGAASLVREIENYYQDFAVSTKFKAEYDDLFHKLKLCANLTKVSDLEKMPPPTGWERDEKYDCLEIIIKRVNLIAGISQDACDIYINGNRFIDMIKEDELIYRWKKSRRGNYVGCPPHHVLLPHNTALIDPENDPLRDEDDGRSYVLACGHCGYSECSTVRVQIDVDQEANTLNWSQIGTLEPGKLGPFIFEKGQYEHAINHGNAAYLTAYSYANGLKGLKKNRTKMLEMLRQAILFGNQQAMTLTKEQNSKN